MDKYEFTFTGQIQLYPGESGWHFVSVPGKLSQRISRQFHGLKRGWGSLKVSVTLGHTTWATSIFPDFNTKIYLLPLKQEVRKQERLSVKSRAKVQFRILL